VTAVQFLEITRVISEILPLELSIMRPAHDLPVVTYLRVTLRQVIPLSYFSVTNMEVVKDRGEDTANKAEEGRILYFVLRVCQVRCIKNVYHHDHYTQALETVSVIVKVGRGRKEAL